MDKKRRLYSISSVVIIAAFLYQASSLIPMSLPVLSSLLPSLSFASELPEGKKIELSNKRTVDNNYKPYL